MATKQERMKRIRAAIKEMEAKDAAKLAIDLCSLSSNAMDFADARLGISEDALQPYKDRIETALSPESECRLSLQVNEALRAIREYASAVGDEAGLLALRVRFVECGTEFPADADDSYIPLYRNMLKVYGRLLRQLEGAPSEVKESYRERVSGILEWACTGGWRYHDTLLCVAGSFPMTRALIDDIGP